jgi:DNA-binding MltR family transcriptional regulator
VKIIKAIKTIRAIKRFEQVGLDGIPEPMKATMTAVRKFRKALTPETDRGCALMAAAFLDETLKELLKANLVNDTKLAHKVFDASGPLGSFSSRIDMAYLLGLIPKNALRDLHVLRKIRNDFAHVSDNLSFETPNISDRCSDLFFIGEPVNRPPRAQFVSAMMSIVGMIVGLIHLSKHPEPQPDLDIYAQSDAVDEYREYLKQQGANIPNPYLTP